MWTEEDMKNAKYLNFLLRHGARFERLKMSSDGFVSLDSILNLKQTKMRYKLSLEIIQELNNKVDDFKRYELKKEEDGKYFIRALNGHSIKGILDYEKIMKREITDPEEFPVVVYSSSALMWDIFETEGIMVLDQKNYIHLTSGYQEYDRGLELMIEIDLKLAIEDGIKFYECLNGVIATTGIGGILEPKYFKAVKERDIEELVAKAFEEKEDLHEITNGKDYPTVVFGTSAAKWEIIKSKGIRSKWQRKHIHLSIGYPRLGQVPSDVYVEIDIKMAMEDGIKFYITANEVIATPGIDGLIDKKYFKIAKNRTEQQTRGLRDVLAKLLLQ